MIDLSRTVTVQSVFEFPGTYFLRFVDNVRHGFMISGQLSIGNKSLTIGLWKRWANTIISQGIAKRDLYRYQEGNPRSLH